MPSDDDIDPALLLQAEQALRDALSGVAEEVDSAELTARARLLVNAAIAKLDRESDLLLPDDVLAFLEWLSVRHALLQELTRALRSSEVFDLKAAGTESCAPVAASLVETRETLDEELRRLEDALRSLGEPTRRALPRKLWTEVWGHPPRRGEVRATLEAGRANGLPWGPARVDLATRDALIATAVGAVMEHLDDTARHREETNLPSGIVWLTWLTAFASTAEPAALDEWRHVVGRAIADPTVERRRSEGRPGRRGSVVDAAVRVVATLTDLSESTVLKAYERRGKPRPPSGGPT